VKTFSGILSPLGGSGFTEVVTHARSKGVEPGKRDLIAFILFVALRHIKSSVDEALITIHKLNNEFIGLTNEEIDSYLKTAITTKYKYSKDSIAEYLESNLEIPADFLYRPAKPRLALVEIKQRQSFAAKATSSARRSKTLDLFAATLMALRESKSPITQESIAQFSGKSVRTVRRYWSQLSCSKGTFGGPLYIPPHPDGLSGVDGSISPTSTDGCSVDLINTVVDSSEQDSCSVNPVVASSDSKRSLGVVDAKSLFSVLCKLLHEIPLLEGVSCPFTYKFRARLSRLLIASKLTNVDAELVAISIAAKVADPMTSDWSEGDWISYCAVSARNMRIEKLNRFSGLAVRFTQFLNDQGVFLSACERSLLLDLTEMAQREDLDPIHFLRQLLLGGCN
jgi:hypothetical protein